MEVPRWRKRKWLLSLKKGGRGEPQRVSHLKAKRRYCLSEKENLGLIFCQILSRFSAKEGEGCPHGKRGGARIFLSGAGEGGYIAG